MTSTPQVQPELINELRRHVSYFADQHQQLNSSRSALQEERDSLALQLKEAKAELDACKESLSHVFPYAAYREKRPDLAAYDDQQLAVHFTNHGIREGINLQYGSLQQQNQALAIESLAVQSERDQLATQHQEISAERDALQAERDDLATNQQALTAQHDSLAKELDALKAERDDLATNQQALTAQYDSLANELDALKAQGDDLAQERDNLLLELGKTAKKAASLRIDQKASEQLVARLISEASGANRLIALSFRDQ